MKSIKFKNVTFGYNKDELVFDNISFNVTQNSKNGFIVGIMGNSGSGKSTIFKLILGLEKQFSGNITICPNNPVISYVPQEPILFEHLSLLDNAKYFSNILTYKNRFNEKRFDELADILQVKNILNLNKSVNEISGGQKQRISLLRALSIQPDILLLDEPLTGLDEEIKDTFLQAIATLINDLDILILYITHHKKEVEFISNQILYLTKINSKSVNEISLSETNSFFSDPPTLSAMHAIKDVSTNIVKIKKVNDKIFKLYNENSPNDSHIPFYYMAFKEDIISFTDKDIKEKKDYEYEYEILHKTGIYSLLKLKETEATIYVRNKKFDTDYRYPLISLNGEVKIYGSDGKFKTNTKIDNNILII